jgi:hypothetical protein
MTCQTRIGVVCAGSGRERVEGAQVAGFAGVAGELVDGARAGDPVGG